MDVELDQIRHGLRTFDSTFFQAPGRMNQYDEHPFKVILDYGHNPAAIKVVSQTIDRFEISGRKICVLAAPGDRRDEDVRNMAKEAAGHFDCYILKADDNRRGRQDREIPLMLQEQLIASGVAEEQTQVVANEADAVEAALNLAAEGDLLLIFGDDITRCWKQIINFNKDNQKSSKTSSDNSVSNVITDGDSSMIDSMPLIKDERGVRLARSEEND